METVFRDGDLLQALGLGSSGGLVSIVGGGGKSSLLFALGELLPGRVILTTTTRIFAAQTEVAPRWCSLDDRGWTEQLGIRDDALLVVGHVEGDRAVGVPPELPNEWIARSDVDWVVVEADGSRMRPVKAPAEHEPVVPSGTTSLIIVAGIDALAGSIEEVAHRPERVSAIVGLETDERLDPQALATLLTSPRGGLQGVPQTTRSLVLLNKVETREHWSLAGRVAEACPRSGQVERVVAGALHAGASGRFRVWSRET